MTERRALRVQVQRHNSHREPPNYMQTYQLDSHPSMTVLEILEEIQRSHDSSLAFRSSCRGSKCGTCAVTLNGKSVLACRTVVKGDQISIGPLPKRPVLKDLIVGQQNRERRLQRLVDQPGRAAEARMPESEVNYRDIARCIECTICTASCPVALYWNGRTPTPDMLPTVAGIGIRSGDEGTTAVPVEANIDYCSLCQNCYAACPAGVDLAHLNSQAKRAYARSQGPSVRNWLLGRPDLLGSFASRSPNLSNRALHNRFIRGGMSAAIGISSEAAMPTYESPFRRWFDGHSPAVDPSAHRKVAYFVGCFNSFNRTQPAVDAVLLLESLGVHVSLPRQQCCGMPMIANGELAGARRRAEAITAEFQPWLDDGYDVITTCTTGSLVLKREFTDTLGLESADELAARSYDLGEYLCMLLESGEIDLDRAEPLPSRFSYHTPCHLRAQDIGLPFIELLNQIPGKKIDVLDTICCGLSGSYGLKDDKFDASSAVAQHLIDTLNSDPPDLVLTECGSCQMQIEHGTNLPTAHPVTILREAINGRD